ncbi:MAG: hypothetical protein ACXWL2_02420 [Candidatus Chromulinivorax sp.]
MKKLQLLTLAIFTATISHQVLPVVKVSAASMMSEDVENQSTPESRLLAKAIELRKKHEANPDQFKLHRLHEQMDKLLASFKADIKAAGRKFTSKDESFFKFCKHKKAKDLQARMKSMKK